jgi:monoamine oxidase
MDVLIIGGGLAGLAAAQRLVNASRSVTLLEAHDRLGGRVWTRNVPGLSYPVELGPEWIGSSGAVRNLLEKTGASLVRNSGTRLIRTEDGHEVLGQPGESEGSIVERIQKVLPEGDLPVREALERCCSEPELAEVRAGFLGYVEGFHAADPDRLSARWLAKAEETQPADASEYHSPDGLGRLIEALCPPESDRFQVRLSTVVNEIRWSRGSVQVVARRDGGLAVFQASQAVVTLPLPILKASPDQPGGVRFVPDIREKRGALDLVEMGEAVKIILHFKRPFWEDDPELRDMLFVHALGQPFPTWWTMHPLSLPLMAGWTAGPQTRRLGGKRNEGLLDLALVSLAAALGIARRAIDEELVGYHLHDWRFDPFVRGAYSYVLAGGIDAHRTLAAPIDNTLFFAGEATCGEGFNATMEGALQSGRRAAEEILSHPDPTQR